MASPAPLKTLAIASVLRLGLARETLPRDLRNELRRADFKELLAWAGQEHTHSRPFGGNATIGTILRRSYYFQKLLIDHDRRTKMRSYYGPIYHNPYVWFYLTQEPDFEKNYPRWCTRTWDVPYVLSSYMETPP